MTTTWTDRHVIITRKDGLLWQFRIYYVIESITGVKHMGTLVHVGRGINELHALRRAQRRVST